MKQDRLTTIFKTCGTGPLILGVGANSFCAKALQTDQPTGQAAPLTPLEAHLVFISEAQIFDW